jgi:hypothetical protein
MPFCWGPPFCCLSKLLSLSLCVCVQVLCPSMAPLECEDFHWENFDTEAYRQTADPTRHFVSEQICLFVGIGMYPPWSVAIVYWFMDSGGYYASFVF